MVIISIVYGLGVGACWVMLDMEQRVSEELDFKEPSYVKLGWRDKVIISTLWPVFGIVIICATGLSIAQKLQSNR